jgi:RPA family protein|tara:strand:+ start:523 stop:1173 length:651 start_codon:yes stop_codon:yes gene_type:complete
MENKTFQKRQIAYKVRIKDLVEGKYIKKEGWQPNYIITPNNIKVSRINIIGIVISIDENPNYKSFTLDDNTEKISVRAFEDISLSNIEIGSIILLIGRPRGYNSDIYIIPETIRRLEDQKWLVVRKLELNASDRKYIKNSQNIKEEDYQEKAKNDSEDTAQKIFATIKKLDNGEGANFDDILRIVNNKDTEEIIDSLIKQGEIFEPRAGKLIIMNA